MCNSFVLFLLFNDTIFNNIAFGIENPEKEKVIEAAKVANAHEFILKQPEGYQTNIGDRGGKLSGGQRQRISIARAILKNPPILILDEATSSLDAKNESEVMKSIAEFKINKTIIIVAHRLNTVRNADKILVLNEGQVIESGIHKNLLEKRGFYFNLIKEQLA